jgi:hypothetical protein
MGRAVAVGADAVRGSGGQRASLDEAGQAGNSACIADAVAEEVPDRLLAAGLLETG